MKLDKQISPLIERQLPSHYHESGSLLPLFLRTYYQWLEEGEIIRASKLGPVAKLTAGSYAVRIDDPSKTFLILQSGARSGLLLLGSTDDLLTGHSLSEIVSGPATLTGTVTIDSGMLHVAGLGTAFLSELESGDYISVGGGELMKINTVLSNDVATLTEPAQVSSSTATTTVYELGSTIKLSRVEPEPNPIYAARSLPEWFDIDTTPERFVPRFKMEYLGDFPQQMEADKRLFIKRALDFYRVKGTPLAVEILFRALYNEKATVFEPWKRVLIPSSSTWVSPQYIEVAGSEWLNQLTGKWIRTPNSGGKAVVEGYVQRYLNDQIVNILTISSLQGSFRKGDDVLCDDLSSERVTRVTGSLSAISITDGGLGFSVGETLTVNGRGWSGSAVVSSVKEGTGLVNFTLVSGGTGYTSNVTVSVTGGGGSGATFSVGELANLTSVDYNTDTINTYASDTIDTYANGFTLTLNTVSGAFTNGEVVSSSANVVIVDYETISGTLDLGETVSNGAISGLVSKIDPGQISVFDVTGGTIVPGLVLKGSSTNAHVSVFGVGLEELVECNGYVTVANATHATVINASAYFVPGATVTGDTSAQTATCESQERHTDWGLSDPLTPWLDVPDNLDTTIANSLVMASIFVGSIASLVSVSHGEGYTSNPTVTVTDNEVGPLLIEDGLGGFLGNNAVITGKTSTGTGIVTSVQVTDSGFGYEPNERLTMKRTGEDNPIVLGRAVIDLNGKLKGYWRDNRSQISSSQRIQDSYYWQKFSYEVQSKLDISKYEKPLRDLAHPAGFALFGKFVLEETKESIGSLSESSFVELS